MPLDEPNVLHRSGRRRLQVRPLDRATGPRAGPEGGTGATSEPRRRLARWRSRPRARVATATSRSTASTARCVAESCRRCNAARTMYSSSSSGATIRAGISPMPSRAAASKRERPSKTTPAEVTSSGYKHSAPIHIGNKRVELGRGKTGNQARMLVCTKDPQDAPQRRVAAGNETGACPCVLSCFSTPCGRHQTRLHERGSAPGARPKETSERMPPAPGPIPLVVRGGVTGSALCAVFLARRAKSFATGLRLQSLRVRQEERQRPLFPEVALKLPGAPNGAPQLSTALAERSQDTEARGRRLPRIWQGLTKNPPLPGPFTSGRLRRNHAESC